MRPGERELGHAAEVGCPPELSRRAFLRGLGALAVASAASLVACTTTSSSSPGTSARTIPAPTPAAAQGRLTLGSNHSDDVPRRALADVVAAFTATTGIEVVINTVDHASFQNQLSTYLQGRPDDVFTWFAGHRMRSLADQGLISDASEVWARVGDQFDEGFRTASTGTDGRQYFVPFYTYPWVLLYRASLWADRGYTPPATWPELLDLCRRMAADGLVPIAFADRDGWPAMGFFDILNLRLNGYAFHIDLLEGRETWRDVRVRTVFERWRELLPFLQSNALGRTWQEAAQKTFAMDAGMYFAGTFAGEQATADQRGDIALLPFPILGTPFDQEHAIDAPINGFMMSRAPANRGAALAFLEYVASPPAQQIWTTANPNYVAAARDADRSNDTPLQQRAAAVIAGASRIAQFFDRDTRPEFSGQAGMQAFLQDFLNQPDQDLDAYLAAIQGYWDSLG